MLPSPKTLLVVDDDASLRTTITRFFRHRGYRVNTASNGLAALTILAGQQFDVVLLDLRMRGMSGEQTYAEMQKSFPQQAERVVFITGDAHGAATADFISQVGRPAVAKPFELSSLSDRVEEMIARAAKGRPAPTPPPQSTT